MSFGLVLGGNTPNIPDIPRIPRFSWPGPQNPKDSKNSKIFLAKSPESQEFQDFPGYVQEYFGIRGIFWTWSVWSWNSWDSGNFARKILEFSWCRGFMDRCVSWEGGRPYIYIYVCISTARIICMLQSTISSCGCLQAAKVVLPSHPCLCSTTVNPIWPNGT